MSDPVIITGATGPRAAEVNGTYKPTGDEHNGHPVYHNPVKDRWLHCASTDEWCVSGTKNKDAMKPAGVAVCMEPNLFDPTHGKTWKVNVGGDKPWDEQGSLVVSHDLSQVCAALPPCVPVSDHA